MLPGSLLGKALHYLTAQWPKLVRYADDGRYPIDNNACENAIRPFVVGRRNAATGCSPTRRPAPTPAPTCTRCCRPAWPTGSTATGTSRHCASSCPRPLPLRTTRLCCPGALRPLHADQQPAGDARARSIDRLRDTDAPGRPHAATNSLLAVPSYTLRPSLFRPITSRRANSSISRHHVPTFTYVGT